MNTQTAIGFGPEIIKEADLVLIKFFNSIITDGPVLFTLNFNKDEEEEDLIRFDEEVEPLNWDEDWDENWDDSINFSLI